VVRHDPKKWTEFKRRCFAELENAPQSWQPLLEAAETSDITLVFGTKDVEHNNAVALKSYLEEKPTAERRKEMQLVVRGKMSEESVGKLTNRIS